MTRMATELFSKPFDACQDFIQVGSKAELPGVTGTSATDRFLSLSGLKHLFAPGGVLKDEN